MRAGREGLLCNSHGQLYPLYEQTQNSTQFRRYQDDFALTPVAGGIEKILFAGTKNYGCNLINHFFVQPTDRLGWLIKRQPHLSYQKKINSGTQPCRKCTVYVLLTPRLVCQTASSDMICSCVSHGLRIS